MIAMNKPAGKSPTVETLFAGRPKVFGAAGAEQPMDREWSTSIFKEPVSVPIWLTQTNLTGDEQADLRHHGGSEKAVFSYPSEHYSVWQKELGNQDIKPGGMGENFSTARLLETDIAIGDTFAIGEAIIQVSQPRQPCWKPARRFRVKELALLLQNTGRTGWYYRVVQEGYIEAGQTLRLLERPHPEWTIDRCNFIMHIDRENFEEAATLAGVHELAVNWKTTLGKRVDSRRMEDISNRVYGPNSD
ncbi:molybdenum cofactor sulfurase [Sporosarcina sp. NCCP-2331]|nr:molybdenum cofactor sulfurase [Sporosarcina sp. NCCP-2331]GLB57626.1 molybdenum cofactor sulfurase [Sporosarcina sp. NCCP-2378]